MTDVATLDNLIMVHMLTPREGTEVAEKIHNEGTK